MQSIPSVLGLLLIAAGCAAGVVHSGPVAKWVGSNLVSCGVLLITEYVISIIFLFEPSRMFAVYSITVITTALVIILGCGRFSEDSA